MYSKALLSGFEAPLDHLTQLQSDTDFNICIKEAKHKPKAKIEQRDFNLTFFETIPSVGEASYS